MRPRAVLALLVGSMGVAAVEAAASVAWATAPTTVWAIDLGLALAWSVIGGVAAWRRPRSGIGLLMMIVGLVLALMTVQSGLRSSNIAALALVSVGLFALGLLPAPALHTAVTYPSGLIPDRLTRWCVWIAYCFAGLDGVRLLLTSGYREPDRMGSPLRVVDDPAIGRIVESVDVTVGLTIILGFVVLFVRRVRNASDRDRRVLAFPFVAISLAAVLFVARVGWLLSEVILQRRTHASASLIVVTVAAGTIAVPIGFLLGLLRERLAYASVGDLLRDVERLPVDQLELSLARALGDPGLRVLFPVAAGYVNIQGTAQELPRPTANRAVTPLGAPDTPVALLVHDPALCDEPGLLAAAGAATRLALDNARLHAEVKAQLAEVRASRARLVSAGDTARRRLERDLHDGAQQRLLTAGLALQMLRQNLPGLGDDGLELLAEAEAELRAALDELRELARGIHPAILTEQGLRAAVDQLADRSAVPVTVTGDPGWLPAPIEATAYFVVNEALVNVIKHARATHASVELELTDSRLRVSVTDDGVGGADPAAGSGLGGLADRVAAVGGTLTLASPLGGGTRLLAELPAG